MCEKNMIQKFSFFGKFPKFTHKPKTKSIMHEHNRPQSHQILRALSRTHHYKRPDWQSFSIYYLQIVLWSHEKYVDLSHFWSCENLITLPLKGLGSEQLLCQIPYKKLYYSKGDFSGKISII